MDSIFDRFILFEWDNGTFLTNEAPVKPAKGDIVDLNYNVVVNCGSLEVYKHSLVIEVYCVEISNEVCTFNIKVGLVDIGSTVYLKTGNKYFLKVNIKSGKCLFHDYKV